MSRLKLALAAGMTAATSALQRSGSTQFGGPNGVVTPHVAAGTGATAATAVFAHDAPLGSGIEAFSTGGIPHGVAELPLTDAEAGVYSAGARASDTPPGGRPAITTPASYIADRAAPGVVGG